MSEKSGGRVGIELEAAEALAALAWPTPHDRLRVLQGNTTNTRSSMAMQPGRDEQDFNRMSYRVHGSGSSIKSRDHLTQAEREERRIRRVLANRESARQTIRRRQAMYEQLTKNAAVLAVENENLRTEKEQALAKYSSLANMNKRLKDLLDKAAKAQVIREQFGDPALSPIKQPSMVPFIWPPLLLNSEAFQLQCTCQKCISEASNVMGAPVYVLPFPWFFPLQRHCIAQSSEQSTQYHQSANIQSEVCMNVLCRASSSSQIEEHHMEKRHASSTAKMNSEMHHLTMSACQEGNVGVAPDRTGKQTAEAMTFNATSSCARASVSIWPSHTPQEPQVDDLADMAAASPSTWSLATKSEAPIYSTSKKSASAAAAAEARKRRKELTKLKTLYCSNH